MWRHRREGGCSRRLNAHGEGREAECRVVEGGKPALELKSNGDLRDVRRLDTVRVRVEELGEGVRVGHSEEHSPEVLVDREGLRESLRKSDRLAFGLCGAVAESNVAVEFAFGTDGSEATELECARAQAWGGCHE